MKTILLTAAALMLGFPALAQTQPVLPTITNGFGTLSATSASAAVSTVTVGVNSNIWVTPPHGNIVIQNAKTSAGVLYVCMLGGTCTSAGWPLSPGDIITFNIGGRTTSPTVIAATTATALIGF
jgi:hypothetical protein